MHSCGVKPRVRTLRARGNGPQHGHGRRPIMGSAATRDPEPPRIPERSLLPDPRRGRNDCSLPRLAPNRLHRPEPDRTRRPYVQDGARPREGSRQRSHLGWHSLPLLDRRRHCHRSQCRPQSARRTLPADALNASNRTCRFRANPNRNRQPRGHNERDEPSEGDRGATAMHVAERRSPNRGYCARGRSPPARYRRPTLMTEEA